MRVNLDYEEWPSATNPNRTFARLNVVTGNGNAMRVLANGPEVEFDNHTTTQEGRVTILLGRMFRGAIIGA